MAKKDSKKSGKKDKAAAGAAEAVEAVRAAVERTFTASAEGAKSTRGRAKDVTAAALGPPRPVAWMVSGRPSAAGPL